MFWGDSPWAKAAAKVADRVAFHDFPQASRMSPAFRRSTAEWYWPHASSKAAAAVSLITSITGLARILPWPTGLFGFAWDSATPLLEPVTRFSRTLFVPEDCNAFRCSVTATNLSHYCIRVHYRCGRLRPSHLAGELLGESEESSLEARSGDQGHAEVGRTGLNISRGFPYFPIPSHFHRFLRAFPIWRVSTNRENFDVRCQIVPFSPILGFLEDSALPPRRGGGRKQSGGSQVNNEHRY